MDDFIIRQNRRNLRLKNSIIFSATIQRIPGHPKQPIHAFSRRSRSAKGFRKSEFSRDTCTDYDKSYLNRSRIHECDNVIGNTKLLGGEIMQPCALCKSKTTLK